MSRIVIAGAGVAGLEALGALRAHLGPSPAIDLVDSRTQLVERPRTVVEPFGGPRAPRIDLESVIADHDGRLRPDLVKRVDTKARRVETVRGDDLDYDALLVAVGARTDVAIPGAVTFAGTRGVDSVADLVADLRAGRVHRVAFAVPAGVSWALPLYELALLTADLVVEEDLRDVRLWLVTPEHEPLDLFGPAVARRIRSLLLERGIVLRTHATPVTIGRDGLELEAGQGVPAQRVVALPRLSGPWIAGLPHDDQGFVPVDEHGAVRGVADVWAAGDGTDFPIRQGGLAAQEADVAAAAIAARLGADVEVRPFRPVLRGLLLDPRGRRFLDSARDDMADAPLWWPPSKIAATHLSPYLAAPGDGEARERPPLDVGGLLLTLAERHALAGDDALALRCFDAARQVLGTLPRVAATRRAALVRDGVGARAVAAP